MAGNRGVFVGGRLAALAPREVDLGSAVERLVGEFRGTFNRETIERFIHDSAERLGEPRITIYVPIIAERFARDRLKALARAGGGQEATVPSVLFLCVHNAGRSQMAAGWVRRLAGDRALVWSGGSDPESEVNAAVIAAMQEVGIDISREFPKPWTDEIVRAADVVVTMGCGDACPLYPGVHYLDWEVAEPHGASLDEIRAIRDDLERRVRRLLAELEIEVSA